MKTGDCSGDWQEVKRRKPYPNNWRHSQTEPPTANPYQPYAKPTYAQVLRHSPTPSTMTLGGRISPASTHPNSPNSRASSVFYVSPHSPSRLRFPPSHTFPEWRGRCFRCCRTGHSAAKCRNPKRCGKCWAFGHIGSKCQQDIVPPPPPVRPATKPITNLQSEPSFDELLTESYPYRAPEMPKERALRLHCFIPRDVEYFAELNRLKQGVVMYTGGFQRELSIDNVCDYACRTKVVTKEEIQVSELSGLRFLIMLPEGLDPDTFINATPQEAWDEGLSFQPWTPLEDASISIPAYKILLRLVGVPPDLFKEKYVAQAICHFGVFLGFVAPESSSSLASWIVAVGVFDLSLVPPELVLHVGGIVRTVQVHTLAWERKPIYTSAEMPKHPTVYRRPQPPPSSNSSSDNEAMSDDLQLIPMSSQVLREMCRGRTADSLPPELRRFATIEEKELDYTCMSAQNKATIDPTASIQGVSNTAKTIINKPEDQLLLKPASNGVTGRALEVVDQLDEGQACHSHKKSDETSSLKLNPKGTAGCNDVQIASVTEGELLQGAGQFKHVYHRLHQTTQVSNPQKIWLRGESSKTAVTANVNGTKAAQNKKVILLGNRNKSKNIPTKTRDNNRGVIIADNSSPNFPKLPNMEHVSRAQKEGFVFQAKGKGKLGGPINNDPTPRKYKWTRPVTNSAQVTKQIIAAASNKRKNPTIPYTGPAKKATSKQRDKNKAQAEVSFNSEGFYEVQVNYEHVSKLAVGCGFKTSDVEQLINSDNAERQLQTTELNKDLTSTVDDDEADLSRFELDPNDELTSEKEA